MLYGIISDVHANLEALERILDEVDSAGVEELVSLGDIVGYGANPNECVELLRERNAASILGNHDTVACGLEEPIYFNDLAKLSILWTREQLTEDNKEFLKHLPNRIEFEDFLVVHGSISHPDKYIRSIDDVVDEFDLLDKHDVGFFGHTHVAACYILRGEVVVDVREDELMVEPSTKYLINPGSVGQPRDRDPRAGFVTYDTESGEVRFHRIDYNIPAAQTKILEAGLSSRLAERLTYGM